MEENATLTAGNNTIFALLCYTVKSANMQTIYLLYKSCVWVCLCVREYKTVVLLCFFPPNVFFAEIGAALKKIIGRVQFCYL